MKQAGKDAVSASNTTGEFTSAARLEATGVSVHFGSRSALEGITAAFGPAETVSLLGPNGAGKSTLLKVLAGMLPPSHGEVLLDGAPVRKPAPGVVYVPQRTGVDWTFPVNVLDVALMGRAGSRSRLEPFSKQDRADAMGALERVGMHRFAEVQIGQLSGGQQQRVFLARALLQSGKVYLLDEPFAGVDVPTQDLLIDLFSGLRREGRTIIYATHDLAQAAKCSDRILLINRRVMAEGHPQQVMTATNLRATFGGQAILVPVEAEIARGADGSTT
ncbi:MAG: metal ABC transporter ATP-binding protein [Chloroflexota bacterium]|nr:metal ABC transporter ATP-binding protein [Chloroflexota bacterium]